MKEKRKNIILSIMIGVVFVLGLIIYQKWAIAKEINLQKAVFAQVDIPPRTMITDDMVEEYEISGSSIPPNAVSSKEQIIGMYTDEGYGVVQNSILLTNKLLTKEELPDVGILDLEKNEEAFPLLVDLETSLGNSILPKSNVDLYFRTVIKERKNGETIEMPIFGKLASHVRVTAAKDTQATNVFEEKEETKQSGPFTNQTDKDKQSRALTKLYIFAVTPEQNKLLNKGKLVGEIVPVATGMAYEKVNDEGELAEQKLIEWIEKESSKVQNNEIEKEGNDD